MNRFCMAAAMAALTATSVQGATVIPVPRVPGASYTFVFDINDNNVIAGAYISGDSEHAFFGTLQGDYQTFDFTPTGGTEARAIDNAGRITGISHFYESQNYCQYIEFERFADGRIGAIKQRTFTLHGIVQGFTSNGTFVGDRCKQGTVVGYDGRYAKYRGAVTIGVETASTNPRDINASGDIVGQFINAAGAYSAFLLRGGVTSVIDYPNAKAVNTVLHGLNNGGIATGHWDKGDYQWHAFALNTNTNTFSTISVPGASTAQAFGINKAGLIAVNANGPYIYCPTGATCPAAGPAVAVHHIRVSPGSFLRFDFRRSGRPHSPVSPSRAGQVNADGNR
jgi:uncharacterized membrane protein